MSLASVTEQFIAISLGKEYRLFSMSAASLRIQNLALDE